MQLYARLRLAFAAAPVLYTLTLLHTVTRRLVLQKVQGRFYAPSACKHRVSGSLSLPSRGAFHLSLTVLFAIGHQEVFSLGGWSPRLPTGFLVSCGTLDTRQLTRISPTGLLPAPADLSRPVRLCALRFVQVLNPGSP